MPRSFLPLTPWALPFATLLLGASGSACKNQTPNDLKGGETATKSGVDNGHAPGSPRPAADQATPGLALPSPAPGPKVRQTPVFIVMGGYVSCEAADTITLYPPQKAKASAFLQIKAAIEAQSPVPMHYIQTCYGIDQSKLLYSFDAGPGKPVKSALIADMMRDLADYLRTIAHPQLFVIGHSYGGWSAMYMLVNLSPDVSIGGVITLDAISRVDCNPAVFLDALNQTAPVAACTRAPTDLPADDLAAVGRRSGFWQNYYQADATALHSGPIAAATLNQAMVYGKQDYTSHVAFITDVALLAKLQRDILAAVSTGTGL